MGNESILDVLTAIREQSTRLWSSYPGSDEVEDAFSDGYDAGMLSLVAGVIDQNADVDKRVLMDAYARYDADPRVHGPEDFEAFSDAVIEVLVDQIRHLVPELSNA